MTLAPSPTRLPVEGEFQEKTRSPVGRWGRSSRRRWGRELRSRLGGGGRFPGRRQLGLAVPTGAPVADGPRPLCPQSSAAARSNVTAGPRAGVRGAGLDLTPPRRAPGSVGAAELLGGGGAAAETLNPPEVLGCTTDLPPDSNLAPHRHSLALPLPQTCVLQVPVPCPLPSLAPL